LYSSLDIAALHIAAGAQHVDCVRSMLERGARQEPDQSGTTPQMLARKPALLQIFNMVNQTWIVPKLDIFLTDLNAIDIVNHTTEMSRRKCVYGAWSWELISFALCIIYFLWYICSNIILCQETSFVLFLAHLSTKCSEWAIVTVFCPLSVSA